MGLGSWKIDGMNYLLYQLVEFDVMTPSGWR
jgi:hypothetical protein